MNLDVNYNDVDIVSFDIFDTLLIRKFTKPTDLFKYIGGSSFERERKLLERTTRDSTGETIYDKIYNSLPEKYKKYKDIELETELQQIRPYEPVVELFNKIKESKKRIILISDMYLPSSFIEKMLAKCNISGYEKIYVSCEHGVSKYNGKLFRKVLKELRIEPGKMLHIGDNGYSDIEIPNKLGIKTFKIPSVLSELLKKYPRLKLLKDDLAYSYFIGNQVDFKERSYWERIGYVYGSIVAYPFVYWIKNKVKEMGIETLVFAGRDGYVLKLIYDKIDPSINTIYAYANRIMAKSGKDYSYYFNNIGCKGKTAIVDLTTLCFSSQDVSNIDIGLYFWLRDTRGIVGVRNPKKLASGKSKPNMIGYSFASHHLYLRQCKSWEFFETLIAAPEPPVVDIDKNLKPIYMENVPEQEKHRIEIIKQIIKGILDYDYDPNIKITDENILTITNMFLSTFTEEDKREFNNLSFAMQPEHNDYHKLIILNRK